MPDETVHIRDSITAPLASIMPNIYYFSDTASTDQKQSSLLQKTADGDGILYIGLNLNPEDSDTVDLYLQAVSQVRSSRSFLQRYAGSYLNDETLAGLSSPPAKSINTNRDL